MALALSQSEAEQKEKERRNRPHIAPDTSLHPTGMINLSFFNYLRNYPLDKKIIYCLMGILLNNWYYQDTNNEVRIVAFLKVKEKHSQYTVFQTVIYIHNLKYEIPSNPGPFRGDIWFSVYLTVNCILHMFVEIRMHLSDWNGFNNIFRRFSKF